MLKLSCWNLYVLIIQHQLLELLPGNLSDFRGLDGLHGLRRWFLLHNDRSLGCHRSMCSRNIFSFLGELMYKLWGGILSGRGRFLSMLFLYSRFVLRYYWFVYCHRSLRCGILLCILGFCMLKLSGWNFCCIDFND